SSSATTLLGRNSSRKASSTTAWSARHTLREWHLATTTRGKISSLPRWEDHARLHERLLTHGAKSSSLLNAHVVASLNRGFELALTYVLSLSQGNIQRLPVNHLLVHFSDGLCSFIGIAEAHETKALALSENLFLTLNCDLVLIRVLFAFILLFIDFFLI